MCVLYILPSSERQRAQRSQESASASLVFAVVDMTHFCGFGGSLLRSSAAAA